MFIHLLLNIAYAFYVCFAEEGLFVKNEYPGFDSIDYKAYESDEISFKCTASDFSSNDLDITTCFSNPNEEWKHFELIYAFVIGESINSIFILTSSSKYTQLININVLGNNYIGFPNININEETKVSFDLNKFALAINPLIEECELTHIKSDSCNHEIDLTSIDTSIPYEEKCYNLTMNINSFEVNTYLLTASSFTDMYYENNESVISNLFTLIRENKAFLKDSQYYNSIQFFKELPFEIGSNSIYTTKAELDFTDYYLNVDSLTKDYLYAEFFKMNNVIHCIIFSAVSSYIINFNFNGKTFSLINTKKNLTEIGITLFNRNDIKWYLDESYTEEITDEYNLRSLDNKYVYGKLDSSFESNDKESNNEESVRDKDVPQNCCTNECNCSGITKSGKIILSSLLPVLILSVLLNIAQYCHYRCMIKNESSVQENVENEV